MSLANLRAAITTVGGTPTSKTHRGLWEEYVTALGGTPTKVTVTGLLRQAITAAGGTPTQVSYIPLLRELIATLGDTPTSYRVGDLVEQLSGLSVGVPIATETPTAVTITPTVQGGRTKTIRKTGGTNTTWGDASAYIDQPLTGDFRVNYTNPDVTQTFACGLVTDPTASNSYTDFDGLAHDATAIKDITTGTIAGSSMATGGNGDTFGLGRVGSQLVRWRNGAEFGTRRTITTDPLYFDWAGYTSNAQVDDVDSEGDETDGLATGALVRLSADSSANTIPYDTAIYDTGFHDAGTPERLTVPFGFPLGRVIANTFTSNWVGAALQKNGATFAGGAADKSGNAGDRLNSMASAIVAMAEADYFTVVEVTAGATIYGSVRNWLAIEPVDANYAVVQKTASQALAANTTTTLTWDSELVDTAGFHDAATNNSRLTVPPGVLLVRLSASIVATSPGAQAVLSLIKNGATFAGRFIRDETPAAPSRLCATSAILAVSAADYFEAQALTGNATNIETNNESWFQIEVLDPATKYCLVNKGVTQTVSASTDTALAFDSEVADTDGAHDNSTNNSRITVPSGVTRARASFNIVTASAAGTAIGRVTLNGSDAAGLPHDACDTTGSDNLNGFGAWIAVVPGDYLELKFFGAAQTLPVNTGTWFCVEFR